MRTSPIFFYRSRGPTSSRRWGPPPAFGAQGCRSLGSRACERITLNAKIAKRAKHLFERFFLCGLSSLCVDVISSHPLKPSRYIKVHAITKARRHEEKVFFFFVSSCLRGPSADTVHW